LNAIALFRDVFDGIVPYAGVPPQGFYPDWLGAMTDVAFRAYQGLSRDGVGGTFVQTRLPGIEDGEGWFEAVNQVEAAREARGRFVMISLGACYGAQAVGSYLALKAVNPMPCKLVAVEPEPTNLEWTARHFRDNGIDPDEHWLIGAAIGDSNAPTLFPVGAPGSGAQNSMSTNQRDSREIYARALTASGRRAKAALRSLLLDHRTGLKRDLLSGAESDEDANLRAGLILAMRRMRGNLAELFSKRPDTSALTGEPGYFLGDIRLISTVTMQDVLGPFDRVDYLEADIQQSESIVFAPFMDTVSRKVRRIHVGTHGQTVHRNLSALFRCHGWDIVFDYEPNSVHQTPYGTFSLNDGVLSAVNPKAPYERSTI